METPSALQCAVVMPAYNEADGIVSATSEWLHYLKSLFGTAFRLIVVNDGSKDKTGLLLDEQARQESLLIVIHQPNGGHGSALVTGYRKAIETGAAYTFQVDSDSQFKSADFARLWERRTQSKFILGYRKIRHDAFHRLVITRVVRAVLFLVYGTYLRDANIPFRLMETRYLKTLLAAVPPRVFTPNIYLSILAKRNGQDLLSIPVEHLARQTGTVSIVRWRLIQVCWRSFCELVQFRVSLLRSDPQKQ